jgi:hypothetical protein
MCLYISWWEVCPYKIPDPRWVVCSIVLLADPNPINHRLESCSGVTDPFLLDWVTLCVFVNDEMFIWIVFCILFTRSLSSRSSVIGHYDVVSGFICRILSLDLTYGLV